jgi:Rieske Fe-S protein
VSRARRALLALLGLACGVTLVAMTAAFIWPSGASYDRRIEAGRLSAYPVGSVTLVIPMDRAGRTFRLVAPAPSVEVLRVWIVHLEDGRLLGLVGRSPHMGCTLPWRPTYPFNGVEGWFRDPCHGSTFARDGTRVFGPSPRDMDRVAIEVDAEGRVFLDVSRVIEGDRPPPKRDPFATPTPAATPIATQIAR